MKKTPLSEFCRIKSQAAAAEIIGCSQSAVSQMIKSGREVYITETSDGCFDSLEISKPKAKKAA